MHEISLNLPYASSKSLEVNNGGESRVSHVTVRHSGLRFFFSRRDGLRARQRADGGHSIGRV